MVSDPVLYYWSYRDANLNCEKIDLQRTYNTAKRSSKYDHNFLEISLRLGGSESMLNTYTSSRRSKNISAV